MHTSFTYTLDGCFAWGMVQRCISCQPLVLFAPYFCNNLYSSYEFHNTKNHSMAGQIQHLAAQKVGIMPWPIRYRPPNSHVSSSAALESIYILELSLKRAN